MPWVHLHVGNGGKVSACCVANIPYGNINNQDLDEIWNGESIQKLRQQFLNGKLDKRCAVCLNVEASNSKSIRQETFEKFPNEGPFEIEVNNLPTYFDIRFSNVCNFRCRTCWHGASSKWFVDAKALKKNVSDKAIIENINDLEDFLYKTGSALQSAEEIYFAGGEPLVTEEHYLLLEYLLANNVRNVRLRYNTNFSNLHFKHYDLLALWKQFSEVEILASVDATGSLGEYIRKDMNWEKILDNRKLLNEVPQVKFKLSPTVSILNIAYLPELYIYFVKNKLIEPCDVYFNILERPYYYNVKALPKNKKQEIVSLYENFLSRHAADEIPNNVVKGFKGILTFMQNEDLTTYWNQFLSESKTLDDLRSEELTNFEFFNSCKAI